MRTILFTALLLGIAIPVAGHQWAYSPGDSAVVHQWWSTHKPGGVALAAGVRGTIDGQKVICHAHVFSKAAWMQCTEAFDALGVVYGDSLAFVPASGEDEEVGGLAYALLGAAGLLALGGAAAYKRLIA